MARVVVTGAAGFIGFHLAKSLLSRGDTVVGIDAFTPYYDVALKRSRAGILAESPNFAMHELALEDAGALRAAIADARPETIVHLAAQAGVRYSLENPRAYIDSNLVGTFNLLEAAREAKPGHLLIASTSSVYGANTKMPFEETDRADHPLTLYAATKKSSEAMAHCYSHLWRIPTTVFRFFTVYGPWGRPDMALFIFTRRIIDGVPIDLYGDGTTQRDFTYIDDLIGAIAALIDKVPGDPREPGPAADLSALDSAAAPFRLINIGHGKPVGLLDFVDLIERCVGRPAIRNMVGKQPGDMAKTFADTTALRRLTGIELTTPIEAGVRRFVDWYRSYYRV